MTAIDGSRLPVVAVVFDEGAATAREITTAGQGLCRPLLLCDFSLPSVARQAALLRATAEVLEITEMSASDVAMELTRLGVSHITTFSEPQLHRTFEIATAAGFRCHSAETISLCTDKRAQRAALRAAGVSAEVRQEVATGLDDVRTAAFRVGLPCVLKPARAAGSRDAYFIADSEALAGLEAAGPWPREGDQAFVVESFLEGDPGVAGNDWGDYVSVEVVTQDGVHQPICVTGKLPLTPPFRETGVVVPSTLGRTEQAECVDLALRAITALGITRGVTHTELKLTADGPAVIEVNARVGGFVPSALKRSTGFDLIATELQTTLGIPAIVPSLNFSSVDFQYFLQPPMGAGKLVALEGIADVRRLDGVLHVVPGIPVGSDIDSRRGTTTFLLQIHGSLPSHNDLLHLVEQVQATVTPTYSSA